MLEVSDDALYTVLMTQFQLLQDCEMIREIIIM